MRILLALILSISFAGQSPLYDSKREKMIQNQIIGRGVKNSDVLRALKKVHRHDFVPSHLKKMAYEDHPLPIGSGQTISQPYIVAYMSEAARIQKTDRVLEIGTGSAYQAAILGELAREVYTIEIIETLGNTAKERLKKLGYKNVHVRIGDGYKGWPEKAPFNAIVVTAAPKKVPKALLDQLAPGGRLVIPVGDSFQELLRYTRTNKGFEKESLLPVRFVPMVRGQ